MASPISPYIRGTTISVRLSRVVDGDTLRVYLPGNTKPESIRILCVDTEESYRFSHKPVTPLGKAAKNFASSFFAGAETVTLEFPDDSPISVAMKRYRGAFNRVLVYVWRESDGADFSEALMHSGYSPYCFKYGHASFASHRARYTNAERYAQANGLGVWDPAHKVNGGVTYNEYARLVTWWSLRAAAVDEFRKVRNTVISDTSVLHALQDYDEIVVRATAVESTEGKKDLAAPFVTIFVDIRDLKIFSTSTRFAIADVGAKDRPLSLYIPNVDPADEDDADDEDGTGIGKELSKGSQAVALIKSRYMDEGPSKPRRGYAFVTGRLQMYSGNPQVVCEDPAYISDIAGGRPHIAASTLADFDPHTPDMENDGNGGKKDEKAVMSSGAISVYISAVLPDPAGFDSTKDEVITVKCTGREGTEGNVNLDGWSIKDASGGKIKLVGNVRVNGDGKTFSGLRLNNTGDTLFLVDGNGRIVHQITYNDADVKTGTPVEFPAPQHSISR